MPDTRYPNESQAYRDARNALLEDEQELVAKVKASPRNAASSRSAGSSRKTMCSSGPTTGKSASP